MRIVSEIVLSLAVFCACSGSPSHEEGGTVVARVGENKLYLSELERFIPEYASPEDSAALSRQYIDSWALDLLYERMASSQLNKEEMDVTKEIEAYRMSLLKYRYQQKYIASRLDTLISRDEVEKYYRTHESALALERPVLKVRFVDIMKDSPYKDDIIRMISSGYSGGTSRDSIAVSSALRFFDNSSTWMDAAALAKEFGTDVQYMMSHLNGRIISMEPEGRGDVLIAYICDRQDSGTAPLEFCEPKIREIILSERKHELMSTLEQDLLEDALRKKKIVIYQ